MTKGTSMPPGSRINSQVPNEYQRLEIAMKEARIPTQLWEGIGDIWVNSPSRAHALIGYFKAGATVVRTKAAAPGMTTIELPTALAAALASARAAQPDAAIEAALQQIGGTATKAGGQLRDTQKPAIKSASLTPIEQIARQTMPELYAQKGTKNR
jgi:hypothetical protein